MSIIALPTLCESNIVEFLKANYSGGYNLYKGFSVEERILPAVEVKAGTFNEVEPGTHVFGGDLEVAILTQIDETTQPVTAHDDAVATIYELLTSEALLAAFNASENGHLYGVYIDAFAQESKDRSLVSVITLKLHVQTLAL